MKEFASQVLWGRGWGCNKIQLKQLENMSSNKKFRVKLCSNL